MSPVPYIPDPSLRFPPPEVTRMPSLLEWAPTDLSLLPAWLAEITDEQFQGVWYAALADAATRIEPSWGLINDVLMVVAVRGVRPRKHHGVPPRPWARR